MRDLRSFAHFILRMYDVPPAKVEEPMVQRYVAWLYDRGREKASQARSLSGVKSFFNFLLISDRIDRGRLGGQHRLGMVHPRPFRRAGL